MRPTIAALYIYPIKSCGGIAVPYAEVTARGLRYDRRYMIVDAAGDFVTQRETPRLAQIATAIDADTLRVVVGGESFAVPLDLAEGAASPSAKPVRVWDSIVPALPVSAGHGDAISAAISRLIGRPVQLVYMPHDCRRDVEARYATGPDDVVSFADGFPLLVASTASLADLNRRLTRPASMEQFRPNVVVSGLGPWAEDDIAELHFGPIRLALVKSCSRCVVVNIDPRTAVVAKEPLRTLATFRAEGARVLFGENAVAKGEGALAVGALGTAVARRAPRPVVL